MAGNDTENAADKAVGNAAGNATDQPAGNASNGQSDQNDQNNRDEEIRTRAYYLWEQASEPKGAPDQYWEQARAEIEKEAPPVEGGPVGDDQGLIEQKPLK